MDKVYDFNWIIQEIDGSIIFMLYKDNKVVGGYQATYVLAGDMKEVNVKFANIDDLDKFLSYAVVRFCDARNPNNIIDIPISKMKDLYAKSNNLLEPTGRKRIKLDEIACFSVKDKKVITDDYQIEAITYNDISDELKEIFDIASKYNEMGMQDKFDALYNINLTNYRVEKKEKNK